MNEDEDQGFEDEDADVENTDDENGMTGDEGTLGGFLDLLTGGQLKKVVKIGDMLMNGTDGLKHTGADEDRAYKTALRGHILEREQLKNEAIRRRLAKAEMPVIAQSQPIVVSVPGTSVPVGAPVPMVYGELPLTPRPANFSCDANPKEFTAWLESIGSYPAHVVILGTTGGGKSACGHALLEYLHFSTGHQAFLFAPMSIPRRLLPSWLCIIDDWDAIPNNALVLIDEATLMLNSRNPGSKANRSFTELNAISRQKNLCLIFVSQSSRSLDINALMVGAVDIIYKKPPTFAGLNERREIKDMTKLTKKWLDVVDQQHIKEYSVIFASSGDVMLMKSGLASYWSEDVSTMYKNCIGSSQQDQVESASKKDEILKLNSQGITQQEIAQKIGVSPAYVCNVIAGKK